VPASALRDLGLQLNVKVQPTAPDAT
jgi:hypothetical protein